MLNHGLGVATESAAEGRMLGLWYDPDRLIIEGLYCDEITAYRARKRWIEALTSHFLLEESLDFVLKVKALRGERHFKIQCNFLTACGRYAFWRLTHHQAIEVQYILETAHLPKPLCGLSVDSLFSAEDFTSDMEAESCENRIDSSRRRESAWEKALRRIQVLAGRISKVTRSLSHSNNYNAK